MICQRRRLRFRYASVIDFSIYHYAIFSPFDATYFAMFRLPFADILLITHISRLFMFHAAACLIHATPLMRASYAFRSLLR